MAGSIAPVALAMGSRPLASRPRLLASALRLVSPPRSARAISALLGRSDTCGVLGVAGVGGAAVVVVAVVVVAAAGPLRPMGHWKAGFSSPLPTLNGISLRTTSRTITALTGVPVPVGAGI